MVGEGLMEKLCVSLPSPLPLSFEGSQPFIEILNSDTRDAVVNHT